MPRNGTGTYSAPSNSWNPPVNGTTANSADWAATQADYVAALSQSVSADGQTPMVGNFPLGNNKITNLAPGTATTDAATYGQVVHGTGQCLLTKVGGNLVLSPLNGNQISINGTLQVIPNVGISLAPGAVTPLTLYYIYAFMSGSTMTLEAVTTAPAVDVLTGVKIKTGDSTRTLVGMARPIAGPLWVDTPAQRLVISWFNPRPIDIYNPFPGGSVGSGGAFAQIAASSARVEFLTWGDKAVSANITGWNSSTVSSTLNYTTFGLDGTAVDGGSANTANGIGTVMPATASFSKTLSEGFHFLEIFGKCSGGSCTWAGTTVGERCMTQGTIQG